MSSNPNNVPNIGSPSFAYTLEAETPINIEIPTNTPITRARFKSTGDFWASAGSNGGFEPSSELTAGVATVSFTAPIAGSDPTGLANVTELYSALLKVAGASLLLVVSGQDAQTFTELVEVLNDLVANGTFAIAGGAITFTTDATGYAATLSITDSDENPLFASLADFAGTNSIDGTQTTSPILNPGVVSVQGQSTISIASDDTPTVSVTFF